MKKLLISLIVSLLVLSGCSSSTSSSNDELKVYKLGVNGTEHLVWQDVSDRLEEFGIKLEIVEFADYVQPNKALTDGDIDLNAFQTVNYFENFTKENNITNLSVLGYTVVAPMGAYSDKVKDLKELDKEKTLKVAIPNDTSNGGRAIKFLEKLGYIVVDPSVGNLPTVVDITEYKQPLEIVEMAANQIPASLPDLDFAIINNGVAYQAGLTIKDDAIVYENPDDAGMDNYYNIIAVRSDELENPDFKKVLEVYQTKRTKEKLIEQYGGQSIPVW